MPDHIPGTQQSHVPKPWLTPEFELRRKPLIDFCTNEWQKADEKVSHRRNPSDEARLIFTPGRTSPVRIIRKRWVKRCTYAAIALLFWFLLRTNMRTNAISRAEESAQEQSGTANLDLSWTGQTFGTNRRPHLSGITQLGTLDTLRLGGPRAETSSDGPIKRRLIFIGDIHGCHEELMHLLAKLEYNEEADHIITTGDMINKGPSSGAVVDFLISKGASCVRGNHEDRILLKAAGVLSSPDRVSEPASEREDSELRLASSLTPAQLNYLQSCPVVLSLGQVPHHGDMVVVHAGLVPSIPLADQDPWAAMNMRLVHHVTQVPSKEHKLAEHVSWAEMWNELQEELAHGSVTSRNPRNQLYDRFRHTTVVYGHDAQQGLQIRKYTKGLDSNCVRGRKLTAMVLSDNPNEEIFQVACGRYY